MNSEKPLLIKTMTNENYQLARLHYIVRNRTAVIKKLSKLKCTQFDPQKNCWEWRYEAEAKLLGLAVPYEGIPVERRPIILGRIFFRKDREAHIDVNSFGRAVKAIAFFDQHLGKVLFEVTEVEVLNQLFGEVVNNSEVHAQYFDSQPSPRNKWEVAEENFERIMAMDVSIEQKRAMCYAWTEESARKPLEKIERLPVNFYTDGLKSFETALRFREMIAIQHWLGNKDYSFYDMLKAVLPQDFKPVGSEIGV